MSELLAIFEKINQIFKSREYGEEFKMYFSPYSMGYTSEDFLFLKASSASSDGIKALDYYDEACEFANTANNIPRSANGVWNFSQEQQDILYNNYKEIVDNLDIITPAIDDISRMYRHPVFRQALDSAGNEPMREQYAIFLELFLDASQKLETLKKAPSSVSADIEKALAETHLAGIVSKWEAEGFRKDVEEVILAILVKESERFEKALSVAKGKLIMKPQTVQELPFFFTTCFPNNLYESDKLSWSPVVLQKAQIAQLTKNSNPAYAAILAGTGLEQLELEQISFELLFAQVIRPWFDEKVLLSPFWNLRILNKEEISIPRYPTELVYVRKIIPTLKTGSLKNEEIISRIAEKPLTAGLFNMKFTGKNQVNILPRKGSANLEKKMAAKSTLGNAMGPKFRLLKNQKTAAIPVKTSAEFSITFKNLNSGELINPVNAIIKADGQPFRCFKKIINKVLMVSLPVNKNFTVELNEDSYENPPFPISANPKDTKAATLNREFTVRRKAINRRKFDHSGNFITYEVVFELEDTGQMLDPTSAEVCLNGVEQPVYRQVSGRILTLSVNGDKAYTIELINDGQYLEEKFTLQPTAAEKAVARIKRKFIIRKKPEIITDPMLADGEFLLIGVICKELPAIPRPLF